MSKKEIHGFINNFLSKNKDTKVLAQKKGYRTYFLLGWELAAKINQARIFLQRENILKGDKIIILGHNSVEWVTLYIACILSGITVVPLDVQTNEPLLQRVQRQIRAQALFVEKGLATLKLKTYFLDELENCLKAIKAVHLPPAKVKSTDILQIVYTSGTTGEPKGVILTYENMMAGIRSAGNAIPLKLPLRMLNLLPLSHIFGQVYGLFLPLHFGHQLFFTDSLQPRKIISFIRNKRIHGAILVPGLMEALKTALQGTSLRLNLGWQFRLIGVGGASLDPKLEKWWKRHFVVVVQGYGLTETAAVVSVNKPFVNKTGSVGKIAEGAEIKLDSDGEILVRGKNVTPGYYQDEQKTKESFTGSWFKTGDIGEVRNGYLYIKERKKEVIKTAAGLNIYPIDIETILNRIDGVKGNCILEKDEKIHAVLLLNKKVKVSEIIEKVNKKLLAHQKIQSYSLWPGKEFPKTPTGKIKKFLVLEEIQQKKKVYQYEDVLYKTIGLVLRPEKKITSASKLTELGMDSLKRVELVSALEKEFNVELAESALNQYTKVADLKALLERKSVFQARFRRWPLNPAVKVIRILGRYMLVYPLIWIFTRTLYSGIDNITKTPVILASNHQSAWDAPVILKTVPAPVAIPADAAYVFGIGKIKPFPLKVYRKITGFLAALFFNAYPFGESIGTEKSLEFTGEMLDRGYSILIFPEAHRTPDGKIKPFKLGIGYMALHLGAPVIPVKVEGLFEVLPINKIIPHFGKSRVKVGKPREIHDVSYIQATKNIEQKVKEL